MASTQGESTKSRMVERLRNVVPVKWTYKSVGGRRWVSDRIKGQCYIVKSGPPYTVNKVSSTGASHGVFPTAERMLQYLKEEYTK